MRELLVAFVESASDPIFVKDVEGRYVLCNESAARLYSLHVADVIGKRDADLLPSELAARFEAVDRRVLATGEPELVDERLAGDRHYLTRKQPLRDASGALIGLVGIVHDVTDRVRAEQALAEREALLRIVIDALPIGVSVVDIHGDVLLANPACTKIWGRMIERGEQRWERSRGWWHGTRRPVHAHEWASVRALHEGRPQLEQLIDIESFDGVRRTIRNSAVPVQTPRGIAGAVIVIEDITERVRLQQGLAHASQLEALGRLAGGIAHDFNNLLMVIGSFAEIVLSSLPADDRRRSDLREVTHAVDSASHLTRQLLAFGRRETSQPRVVAVEDSVAAVCAMLGRLLGTSIEIQLEVASAKHHVYIDPVQFEQVLVNLALNARDAMPDGGVLTLSTRDAGERHVVIGVRDTGIGMDEETRQRIFEPFFTTKERGHGTGLGLATAYGLVSKSGGRIEVTSSLGQGTLFEIELPLLEEGAFVAPLDARTRPQPTGASILLVEDSAAVRLAVRAMLTSLGYQVHEVDRADAAVAFLAGGGAADLLLTDVRLPGRSGHALADELRATHPDLRVLFMSGYPDDIELAGNGDAARMLAKPFSIDTLATALAKTLAREP